MRITSNLSDQAILGEFGKRLAQHRLNLGISQIDLAEQAGVSATTVHRMEKGLSIQLGNLIRILRVLDLGKNLDVLLPELPPSPIELAKFDRERRKRAPRKRQSPTVEKWTWGEE